MKKIITAITLAALLGCEQTPKQKSVDTVVDEPVVKKIVKIGSGCGEPQYVFPEHDHDSGYFHDAQQIPQKFSGMIEVWVAKIGVKCIQCDDKAGLTTMDVYKFIIKTSEGTKELEVIAYEAPEKRYLKSVASIGTHVTCSYATWLSRADMLSGRQRYRAPFSDFIKTEDLK